MSNEQTLDTPLDQATALQDEFLDEELDSIGDHHRMAAHHFSLAAEHHIAAAAADDDGDDESNARHAYLAYRHQLNAVQYAEIAALDNDCLDDAIEG
ncbi:hypothetical protein LNV09_14325 [Paucibacter sp. B2R-40]|uniref:hypothetical protein n=1 Tax=Paucibacter sp. B2R-40 TaxID=2893554 RepID=UPI0021E4C43B|nr:hypothetical protein [Paucibacter sp. B2R-40]MCV2355327.1 hypothetical protein [Paucibacter sp. B2R-40]